MSNEISMVLSIEKGRIFIPYDRYQYKRNTSEDQILLLVNIKDTKKPDQPSSFMLRRNLNNTITYKDNINYISVGPHARDLDSTYGASEIRRFTREITLNFLKNYLIYLLTEYVFQIFKKAHLWVICRYALIGVVSGLSFLLFIWFVAANKFPKGKNFSTIIFYSLILVDFVLDIIVLRVHGSDLKWFYICGCVPPRFFFYSKYNCIYIYL